MTQLQALPTTAHAPFLIAASGEPIRFRFPEFFTDQIRNPHTHYYLCS